MFGKKSEIVGIYMYKFAATQETITANLAAFFLIFQT